MRNCEIVRNNVDVTNLQRCSAACNGLIVLVCYRMYTMYLYEEEEEEESAMI